MSTKLASETISIPGAVVNIPPTPGERIYAAAPDFAYERPSSGALRSAAEVLRRCAPDENNFIQIQPEKPTIFDAKAQLGKAVVRYAEASLEPETTADVSRFKAMQLLDRVDLSEREQLAGRLLGNNESARCADLLNMTEERINSRISFSASQLYDMRLESLYIDDDPKDHEIKWLSSIGKALSRQRELDDQSLTRSPLHDKAGNKVVKLRKDGTDTYVLPKEHEASVRIIPPSAATAWMKAFENWPLWYEQGFNYVPIEPILAVDPTDKPELTAVTTTNLSGRSLPDFLKLMPEHTEELVGMRNKIAMTIKQLGIKHGHMHDRNFVAVPYTLPNGDLDRSKCPKLYAIDFDKAEELPAH